MTLVAWSKISKEKSTNIEDTNSTKTSKISKKTVVITCLVLGFILTQTLILAKVTFLADKESALETKLSDLEAKNFQLKKTITSLNKKDSPLETTLSDLEAKNSQLKKNINSLTNKDSALEAKLSNLELQVDELKAKVRLYSTHLI